MNGEIPDEDPDPRIVDGAARERPEVRGMPFDQRRLDLGDCDAAHARIGQRGQKRNAHAEPAEQNVLRGGVAPERRLDEEPLALPITRVHQKGPVADELDAVPGPAQDELSSRRVDARDDSRRNFHARDASRCGS
jgi:hypothetical protein